MYREGVVCEVENLSDKPRAVFVGGCGKESFPKEYRTVRAPAQTGANLLVTCHGLRMWFVVTLVEREGRW